MLHLLSEMVGTRGGVVGAGCDVAGGRCWVVCKETSGSLKTRFSLPSGDRCTLKAWGCCFC